MAEKKSQDKRREQVTELFSGKPVPGGLSNMTFERVINALKSVITADDKEKKRLKEKKTQGEILFGKN